MASSSNTVILGAGLAGLSAAYHLRDDYIIFEKDSRVGGLCRSENYDGFVFDYAIHILYSSDGYATELIKTLLGDNFQSQTRESWVYYRGVYTEYPFQAYLYGHQSNIIKDCILGLIKARYENLDVKPSNFEEWINVTFGEGIAKHFMIPYNKKVWAIDPSKMDFNWIADRVPVPSIENVLDGALKPPQKKYGPNSQFWYPLKGGMEFLPKGFLPFVKNIEYNSEVTSISIQNRMMTINGQKKVMFDRLVSSLPLPKLIELIDNVPKEIKDAASNLEYNIVYAVNIAVDRSNISDKHWLYFQEDDFIFQRISFPMNLSPYMAPNGKSSITAEISTSKHRPIKKEDLIDRVLEDLIKANILKKDDKILFKNLFVLDPAYVIYDLSHKTNVDKIHSFLRKNNIFPTGRFGEWEYLNMDQAILSGKKIAEEIKNGQ